MKLWKISQRENNNYDTYDSAVVAAESEEIARHTSPRGGRMEPKDWHNQFGVWCSAAKHVSVEYLGEAKEGTEEGVICASFNAG